MTSAIRQRYPPDPAGPTGWYGAVRAALWRPRYDAHVVAGEDLKLFTLGRLPDEPRARRQAGVRPTRGESALTALRGELVPVGTPIGAGWILARDEASFRHVWEPPTATRLLPSGDTWYLLPG